MKKQLVVSFFGGPGVRKSTMCAHVFAELKWLDINCEIAHEYAKVKVWEKANEVLKDQLYVFGKQYHAIKILEHQVEIILTDSPLLLSIIYDEEKNKELKDLVLNKYREFYNLPILLTRKAKFNQAGREQDESQSIKIDEEVENLLEEVDPLYYIFEGVKESVQDIVTLILEEVKIKNKK